MKEKPSQSPYGSLSEFTRMCIRNMSIDAGGLVESGSATAGIMHVLTTEFRLPMQAALQVLGQIETQSGFNRGEK